MVYGDKNGNREMDGTILRWRHLGIEAHYDFIIQENSLLIFSDKKVIPADLIMILSQYFRFVGVSISENTPLLIFEYE